MPPDIPIAPTASGQEWIERLPGAPYFADEKGEPWTPIGHNEAISWANLRPLIGRRDPARVEAHLAELARQGINCLRLMLEYAQYPEHYLEEPFGRLRPVMVQFWDDLFALARRHGIRFLLTPYDTYWMWVRWSRHPANARRGGPLADRSALLTDPAMRAAIKVRLSFAIRRWGGDGTIFAWDLWNEIHPAHAGDSADDFGAIIAELSRHVRAEELAIHGRTHLQTVSIFGPELVWRAHMPLREPLFRHRDLDFATIHIYAGRRIDAPVNTVDGAAAMAEIVAESLSEIMDGRPFLDSEHGPIHAYKDRLRPLKRAFDEEYFRTMQWAHLAAGGAGGGMRWPNRRPHVLSRGMHAAQAALARFAAAFNWKSFGRRNVNGAIELRDRVSGRVIGPRRIIRAGSASADRAILYLVRRDRLAKGRLDPAAPPLSADLALPGFAPGRYRFRRWDSLTGLPALPEIAVAIGPDGVLRLALPDFVTELLASIEPAG